MTINTILIILTAIVMNSCFFRTESGTSMHNGSNDFIRIAFYNTENLFDTIDDPHTRDNDFLPDGKLKWNTERYEKKVARISEVIQSMNEYKSVAFIGFSEVENEYVLSDILLGNSSFQMIHYNSSDLRGIDVCLLYNEALFTPITSYLCHFDKNDDPELFLREVLLVKGILLNDTVHVLVNHWPSRRGGESKSENKRIAAAMLTQEIIDSIVDANPRSNLIVMGDFNDEPSDESMSVMLKIKSTTKASSSDLINPFSKLKEEGEGTCKYKRDWFLFDQILISNSLINKKGIQYVSAGIFKPDWLYYKKDLKSGPFRTFVGEKYYGGYSDHFPVFIEFKK